MQYDLRLWPATEGASPPVSRHLFVENLDLSLGHSGRLPPDLGGFLSTKPDATQPTMPVASWLLARLAALVEGELASCVQVQEREATIPLHAVVDDRVIGTITLNVSDVGSVSALFRASDITAANDLRMNFVDTIFAQPLRMDDYHITFIERSCVLGRQNGQLLGSLPKDYDLASIVERILERESVPRLPDDRLERCPRSQRDIAQELGEWPSVESQPVRVKYVQSVDLGDAKAWVFRITRKPMCAVVLEDLHGVVSVAFIGW